MSEKQEKENFLDTLKRISAFTPAGLSKWIWFKLSGRQVVIKGQCKMCGSCCRGLNLSHGDRWIRTEKQFQQVLDEYPDYDRFHHIGETEAGLMIFECDRLTEDGKCGDHETRPDLCRDYPDPDLLFSGGELLDHCGYRFSDAPSFEKHLKRAKRKNKGAVKS